MSELNEAQQDAVRALEDGRKLLSSYAASRWGGGGLRQVPDGVQHLAAAIADPATFWGLAAAGVLGDGGEVGTTTAATTAAAIRAAAARLKVGDFGPIREALIGQAGWLAAAAVKLMAAADDVDGGYRPAERRAELIRLALRASDSSARVLASAAALNALAGSGGGGDFVAVR